MIGVVASESDLPAVREFFELFKTPWEPCRPGRRYPVVLASRPDARLPEADLTVVYGFERKAADRASPEGRPEQPALLCYRTDRFPVYTGWSPVPGSGTAILTRDGSEEILGLETPGPEGKRVRIGYDLFGEVRFLLSQGQPPEYAAVPTLDVHICVLRDLIVESGLPLAEIPPVPPGHEWILCLTHDVDFVSIRRHGLDRTVLGFLYRATAGSLAGLLKGRLGLRTLIRNLVAALSLPLIHLGLVRDFFNQFARYLELEGERRSTFFLIPHEGVDGATPDGRNATGRAVRYEARDIAGELASVAAKGCEVGLHGLDAWHDGGKAADERSRIRRAAGREPAGVRMHWLFWSHDTPRALEQAGFVYDSTWGYNEAVGFRAGTAQVFRPFGSTRLLELPLHVQDTALFLGGRMGLTQNQGIRLIEELIGKTRRTGGVLTANWHMRSLGPERLWEEPYRHLLGLAEAQAAWCAPAREVVEWFAKRRSAAFSEAHLTRGRLRVTASEDRSVPGLGLRLYNTPPRGVEVGPGIGVSRAAELVAGRRG